jgi:hypothetical protein
VRVKRTLEAFTKAKGPVRTANSMTLKSASKSGRAGRLLAAFQIGLLCCVGNFGNIHVQYSPAGGLGGPPARAAETETIMGPWTGNENVTLVPDDIPDKIWTSLK